MNGCNSDPVELSYADGEIYKRCYQTNDGNKTVTSERSSDGCISKYYRSKCCSIDKLDQNFPFFSKKEYDKKPSKIKYYLPSNDVYELISGGNIEKGVDLTIYDLCPDVELWVGIGKYQGIDDEYDLIFCVNDDRQLNNICKYYNLKPPLPTNLKLSDDPNVWTSVEMKVFSKMVNKSFDGEILNNFKYGSIKFKGNTPKLMKMYKSNHRNN